MGASSLGELGPGQALNRCKRGVLHLRKTATKTAEFSGDGTVKLAFMCNVRNCFLSKGLTKAYHSKVMWLLAGQSSERSNESNNPSLDWPHRSHIFEDILRFEYSTTFSRRNIAKMRPILLQGHVSIMESRYCSIMP